MTKEQLDAGQIRHARGKKAKQCEMKASCGPEQRL
jgi:hypothetical protein